MSKRAYNRKDHLYNKAKEDGYRSRAAYKLIELNNSYGILKRGFKVLDLGAWPGGWLQVAAGTVSESGRVVGIDLALIDPLANTNVKVVHGDVRDEVNIAAALEFAGDRFDLVLSDMSTKLTGIKEADQAATVVVAELALFIAQQVLRPAGNLVIKVFKSNETDQFVKTLRPLFNKINRTELDASRSTSKEYYLVALGLKS